MAKDSKSKDINELTWRLLVISHSNKRVYFRHWIKGALWNRINSLQLAALSQKTGFYSVFLSIVRDWSAPLRCPGHDWNHPQFCLNTKHGFIGSYSCLPGVSGFLPKFQGCFCLTSRTPCFWLCPELAPGTPALFSHRGFSCSCLLLLWLSMGSGFQSWVLP